MGRCPEIDARWFVARRWYKLACGVVIADHKGTPKNPPQGKTVGIGHRVTAADLCGVRIQDEMCAEQAVVQGAGVSITRLR